MDLKITKGNVSDVSVLVNSTEVTIQKSNSINVEVTPQATQVITIDRNIVGATGAGVATGGTTGQVLTKASNANYDTTWATPTAQIYPNAGIANSTGTAWGTSYSTTGAGTVVALAFGPTMSNVTIDGVSPYINMTPSTAPAYQEGRLFYDSTAHTLNYYNDNSQMSLNIGQEQVIRVRNRTGSTIVNGSVVYVDGATGNTPTISLAIATSFTTADIIGVTTTEILNNGFGYVTINGLVNGLDTSEFAEGNPVFLSATTAGAFTTIEPIAPNYSVQVGVILRANPSVGTLLVSTQQISVEVQHIVGKIQNSQLQNSAITVNGTPISLGGSVTTPQGTVTSVAATAGTGISVSGLPITSSGTFNIVNTAPDQIVSLTASTAISVTGTYPNFIIANTSPSSGGTVTNVSGTGTVNGLTLSGTVTSSGSLTFGGTLNLSSPPTIGNTAPNTGAFTSVTTPSVTATTTDLTLSAISTGAVKFSTLGGLQGQFNNTASTVNYFDMFGSATTKAIQFKSNGSDANISLAFQPKGTGAIDLAAGSSGVNISNGNTVTAITRTAAGSGYTSPPTVAISAPTTAGGVQATATVPIGLVSVTGVVSGGTGYTVNDVLTVSGGTFTVACQLTVTAVSSGVITSASVATGGSYTAAPTNPVSVTGGTGSGATFNLSFCIASGFTITNAGSGYIEQPTVTFSGGGGSGAAAYATVGSATTLRHIGGFHSFTGPSGISFAVNSSSGTVANYVIANSQSTGNYPNIMATGTDAAVGLDIFSKGATPVRIRTGTGGATQFQASDTASAVNYVQVTGAATSGTPVIQAQGSDANVSLAIRARGGGNLFFQPNNLNQFAVIQTASAVNYLQATGSAAGSAPAFSVAGTDADIDLTLTPKGAGNIRFGAYTGTILSPTGYITIKDSGGTTRRLLVG